MIYYYLVVFLKNNKTNTQTNIILRRVQPFMQTRTVDVRGSNILQAT